MRRYRRAGPLRAAPPARTAWAVDAAQAQAEVVEALRRHDEEAARLALPYAIGALCELLAGIENVPAHRVAALAEMVAERGIRVDAALLTLGC